MNNPFLKSENRLYPCADHGQQPIFLRSIEKYVHPRGFILKVCLH